MMIKSEKKTTYVLGVIIIIILLVPMTNGYNIQINYNSKQIIKEKFENTISPIEYTSPPLPNELYIANEEVYLAGEQNDIGYNVDSGNSLHRSLSLYIGEPIEQTIPGRGRIGTLDPNSGDKEDWYRFTLCKNQIIHVELICDENYDIEILDIDENSYGKSYTTSEVGWYFIHVHYNNVMVSSDYTINVFYSGQNDADIGSDAGNSFETATTITPGSYFGYMDCIDVEDWYKFYVNRNDGIFVKVKPIEESDYDIFLYNPLGDIINLAQYYGEDKLEYPADITGFWAIKIAMFPGWDTNLWPEDYFLYGSGVYTLELDLGGIAEKPIDPLPQPDIIPIAQTFIVNNEPTSNKDEYGYLAAISASNYIKDGKRYVSPIVYRGDNTITNYYGTVDDTTQYLIDDWNNYLTRHGIEPIEYIIETEPVEAAANIAKSKWISSDTAVVVIDGSDYKDDVQILFNETNTLNSKTDIVKVSSDISEYKEVGSLYTVPMYISSNWGAIAIHGLGDDFSGEIGITNPKYESLGDDWWPHPYDINGPDTDLYHPITIPGLWMPYTDSLSGLDEMEIIKVSGDRYKIPIDTTDCSINITVITDYPCYLRVYLVDPYGNIRRPMTPHWNGGPINPIHVWNGGHWESIGFDEWRFWEPDFNTEHSVEIHYPMTGKWTAIVAPASVEEADKSYTYHITAKIRMHSSDRINSALSAANGAVIASKEHIPLLYLKKDNLPAETKSALTQLGVKKLIFVNLENIGNDVQDILNEYTIDDLTNMQQVIEKVGDNSDNFITITSLASGDGYFAPSAMIAAYHVSPVISIGEAADAYNTLDMIASWREYAGDYYHGCRSVGHLPEMDHPFDFKEFIKGILKSEFPPTGFDLKKRWFSDVYNEIHELIEGYGLDKPGKEAYLFVAPRDTDIRSPVCRALTGNNSYAGHIPVESPAFSSAVICRDILYPAIIYSNPGRNITSSCLMHFCDPYPWTTNDGQTHQSVLTREMKESGFSQNRFYEGHSIWENLLERYNKGVSFMYQDSHGSGGSALATMYKNIEDQFPQAEPRYEYLKDFDWWDGWRGYNYDDQQTKTPRNVGSTFFNGQEPNLYDPIHFKYCDQLFENLHSQFNLWMSCTTGEHFGPMIFLEHGASLWYGNCGTGSNPQCELLDYWTFEGMLENGLSIGESLSKNIWLLQRDYTTGDPTAMYGVSSQGRTNVHVIYGDPTLKIYSPNWIEPVPVEV
jgi:hypothetical protein